MSQGEASPRRAKRAPVVAPTAQPRAAEPSIVTKTQIELPVSTILKVLVTIGLVLFVGEIWQILFLVFLGLFVALVLARPVAWLEERGLPRGFAISGVVGITIGFFVLVLWFVTPGLVAQVRDFWELLPEYIETTLAWTAHRWPDFYQQAVAWSEAQQFDLSTSGLDVPGILSQGIDIIAGIANIVVVLIIAVYILADQGQSLEGVYQWMPPQRADKLRRTIPAVAKVVNGYVTGQAINSLLFAIFALILLTVLGVPSAVFLALIAAIGDAIPQVGVFLATIPAILLALTQSPQTAVIVLVAYAIYQQFENYVTSPRIFGRTLQLRPLVTLVAILIGGKLLGIVGVLLALPVAAAIPTIAEIWLEDETPEVAGSA